MAAKSSKKIRSQWVKDLLVLKARSLRSCLLAEGNRPRLLPSPAHHLCHRRREAPGRPGGHLLPFGLSSSLPKVCDDREGNVAGSPDLTQAWRVGKAEPAAFKPSVRLCVSGRQGGVLSFRGSETPGSCLPFLCSASFLNRNRMKETGML